MVSSAEIIDYISARIAQDVDFLTSHGFMSPEDQDLIRSRLPGTSNSQAHQQSEMTGLLPSAMPAPSYNQMPGPSMPTPGSQMAMHTSMNNTPTQPTAGASPMDAPARRAVPPPPRRPEFARALWDYNVDLGEPNDLMFRKNDILEITEETNADWWTGVCRGRTGLFPSNHVQRIPYDPHIFPTPPDGGTPRSDAAGGTLYEKNRYPGQMSGAPQMHQQVSSQSMSQPPPNISQNGFAPPVNQANDPSKQKFGGKVGGKLGGALVTGVGFGAGAAIGGGIIDAIF